MEGLQDRRSRAVQGDDPRHRRVHPPFPDARVAHGFHRIRYYGLLASGKRAENVTRARELLTPTIIPVDAIKAISAKCR